MAQSHPNPFGSESESSTIGFELALRTPATLRVFDSTGCLVRLMLDDTLEPGAHVAIWDGRNDQGAEVGSGIYFYRLDAGEFSAIRRLVKLR